VSFSRSFHQALPQPPGHTGRNLRPTPTCLDLTGTVRAEHGQLPYLLNSGLNGHIGPSGVRGSRSLASDHFSLVRSLETVRSIDRPSMGLLRQPTTSKIMEDGRWAGPTVRARIRAHSQKTNLRLRCQSHIQLPYQHIPACWRSSCPDAHRPPTGRLGHRNDPPTARSDASCMASTHRGDAGSPASGPAVISPASMRADTAPNHPMRVRTVHPGWAHAGRQRAGWAKGAWSWRTPSGSRTPPRRTATAIGSVQGAMA
jgi:hypothetical protein